MKGNAPMAESTATEATTENTNETAEQTTAPLQPEPAPTVKTEPTSTPEPTPTPKTKPAPTPEPAPTEITGEAIIHALTQPSGSSTVDPSNTGTQTTTVEEFRKMNGQQRNALYQSNPDLYEQLRATA